MRAPRRLGVLGAIAVAAAALAAVPASAQAPEPKTNLSDIEDEVMCLICGTTLELSESSQADQERDLIRDLIDQGLTKEQVKDSLVDEYGEEVLAVPDADGFELTAWLIPAIGLLLAAGAIGVAMSRMRRRPTEPAADPLDPADASRLERDLTSEDV